MYIAGHDADLKLFGSNNAGTVGTYQNRVGSTHPVTGANHILDGNAFGNTDHDFHFRINSLVYSGGGKWRRHVVNRNIATGSLLSLSDSIVDRHPLYFLPAFLRRNAGNITILAISIGYGMMSMKHSGFPGNALGNNPRIFIYKNGHTFIPLLRRPLSQQHRPWWWR